MTVVHNLTNEFEEKTSAHIACSMKKGKSPKMTSCGPSNFEGDRLHLNLLKKLQIFGSSSIILFKHVGRFHDPRICQLYSTSLRTKWEYSFNIHIFKLTWKFGQRYTSSTMRMNYYSSHVLFLKITICSDIVIQNTDTIHNILTIQNNSIHFSYWH